MDASDRAGLPNLSNARPPFPKRTVHLDFHTGPAIPDVGADFDPDSFARTFADVHVDSVTIFALCHHGHLYFQTDHRARHPHLAPGLDLMGQQIEALHAANILAPVYLSTQVNEFAANAHPEWVAVTPDGRLAKRVPVDTAAPEQLPLVAGGRCWTCRVPITGTWRKSSPKCWIATAHYTLSSWTCAGIKSACHGRRATGCTPPGWIPATARISCATRTR